MGPILASALTLVAFHCVCFHSFKVSLAVIIGRILVVPSFNLFHPRLEFFFTLYMAFGLLGVMNVVTGIFVESAISRADEVKIMQSAMHARRLFKTIDDDGSGVITVDEIEHHMEDAAVQEYFQKIDVEPGEAKCLFEMLDINNSGTIDFEEFVNGCIRLQGSARAIDLLLITRETRSAFDRVFVYMQKMDAALAVVGDMLGGSVVS